MSDDKIDRLVRKEFDGVVSLEDRFHTAASMTDWRNCQGIKWDGYPIVPWNSNTHEMAIPFANCYLGVTFVSSEVVIQFDEKGEVKSTRRQSLNNQHDWFYRRALIPGVHGIEDPWKEQSPQMGSTSMYFESMDGDSVVKNVSAEFSNANRYIGIVYRTYSNSEEQITGQIQISTNPPTDFVVVDEEPAITHQNRMSGAYIVQDKDFEIRSGNKRHIDQPPFDFVPKFVTEYQSLIVLAPHDGVDITVTLVPTEDDS